MTKTDNGAEYPASAYAYVPDASEPSTWKIRLWESPEAKATVAQLGRAAAAMSSGGFRGEQAEIPEADVARVKAKIRSAYAELGVKPDDVPESIRLSWLDLTVIRLSADEKPTRIPICMIGTFHKGKQKFTITRADVQHMANAFSAAGGERVMDYEHASEQPEVAQGQPIPAAGWITSIDAEPDADGVVWGTVNFTERARGLIAAREYKYVSPVLVWGARDSSTGKQDPGLTLMSAALTNTPVLDKMPAIRLSSKGEQTVGKEAVMCSEHPRTQMLCPQCDADELKQKFAASRTAAETVTVLRLADVSRDGEGRISLSRVAKGTAIDIEVIQAMETERIALSEVDAALQAGKITPAQKPMYLRMALSNIEDFRALEKTLGKAVDTTERGHGGTGAGISEKQELEQISIQLSAKATSLAEKAKIPFQDALKRVQRENPDLLKRRNILTRRLHGVSDNEGDED